MSWCCGELVRSEERTRSPRICATAVPLVEHLELERKDLKLKEDLRMAGQRCKEHRNTIRSLRDHNSKLKDENIQLRRTKTKKGYEEGLKELREELQKRNQTTIERNRTIIEAYEEENSQFREVIIQLYRQLYPDDPDVHPDDLDVLRPEDFDIEQLARNIEAFGIPQHDEEDERWEEEQRQDYDGPLDD